MGAYMTPVEHFAFARAALQLCEQILPAKYTSPKILHVPVQDELLENRAVRATFLLNSLLASLASREIVCERTGTIERI